MAKEEQDTDKRIEKLLDQAMDSTSQAEIDLINKKIEMLKSVK